jgi:hypothetical protein
MCSTLLCFLSTSYKAKLSLTRVVRCSQIAMTFVVLTSFRQTTP